MAKQSDKKTEERWDITEHESLQRIKARKVLELAKKQEKQKKETHSWHTSEDGKTRVLRKNQI
jgi:hypothetical protein